VGPTAGLENLGGRKILPLPGLELRPVGRLARSQSPYRLRYPPVLGRHPTRRLEEDRTGTAEEEQAEATASTAWLSAAEARNQGTAMTPTVAQCKQLNVTRCHFGCLRNILAPNDAMFCGQAILTCNATQPEGLLHRVSKNSTRPLQRNLPQSSAARRRGGAYQATT
jgi:hypothetical protein